MTLVFLSGKNGANRLSVRFAEFLFEYILRYIFGDICRNVIFTKEFHLLRLLYFVTESAIIIEKHKSIVIGKR